MASDQDILSQLNTAADRGVRPERAQAALAEVPHLAETLAALEQRLTSATDDAEARLQAAARHLVGRGASGSGRWSRCSPAGPTAAPSPPPSPTRWPPS
jgi:thioredoxin-like negative regulator of GroEL